MKAELTREQSLGPMACLISILLTVFITAGMAADGWKVTRQEDAIVVRDANGQTVLGYQLVPTPNSPLTVKSGGFIHPLNTPRGVAVTEVAPADHPHHRGVFLAWVEMHGRRDADFWGWGEHAPKERRQIVNRSVSDLTAGEGHAAFRALNDWVADGETMIEEQLDLAVRRVAQGHVVDLTYRLRPRSDLVLSQWAFSGFCVRTRKEGRLEARSPDGVVKLPNPKHTDPASDWPAAAWYDYTLQMPDDAVIGVTVVDHPSNPPALWHNHRDVRMLNPCIVAPRALELKENEPLTLRYRVIAHDGPVDVDRANRLAAEFRRQR